MVVFPGGRETKGGARRFEGSWRAIRCALVAVLALAAGCGPPRADVRPSIEFTSIPRAGTGGQDVLDTVAGRVTGVQPGQRVVLFARSGVWWVQPLASRPFTDIRADGTWTAETHLGSEYAALLVGPDYTPPPTSDELPSEGDGVLAVVRMEGEGADSLEPQYLQFSGYEWEIRHTPSDRGGVTNTYDPANAWTDSQGWLHLRISRSASAWNCAEVSLRRSLGYGMYSFTVQDVSHLASAAVLGMFTWDDLGADQNHREVDIEVSQWGDPDSKNAQYAIQPYYVPVNVVRFQAPSGVLTHSFRWEPGRVSFQTARGPENGPASPAVAEHTFTSGVPLPGGESVRMNLYVYGKAREPLQNEAEVVIEKFEFLP